MVFDSLLPCYIPVANLLIRIITLGKEHFMFYSLVLHETFWYHLQYMFWYFCLVNKFWMKSVLEYHFIVVNTHTLLIVNIKKQWTKQLHKMKRWYRVKWKVSIKLLEYSKSLLEINKLNCLMYVLYYGCNWCLSVHVDWMIQAALGKRPWMLEQRLWFTLFYKVLGEKLSFWNALHISLTHTETCW